ncbi:glycosyltransferase [Streptomyces sioyaensis]|uniref:glycosyltransferase n=1 Tax=Streptomyces sioyaensis TaxID=67364 RepID=UPI003D757BC2
MHDIGLARRLETPRSLPRRLHFIWMGAPIRDAAVENILAWAARAKEAGWSVRLWTEWANRQASRETGFSFSLPIRPEQLERLEASGVEVFPWLRDALTAGGPRLTPEDRTGLMPLVGMEQYNRAERYKQPPGEAPWLTDWLWDQAYSLRAFNYLSDIARYGILHAMGGMYVDVDVAPGNVDLHALEGPISQYEVPVYGPILRDKWFLDEERKDALQAMGARPNSAVRNRVHSEQVFGTDTTRMPLTMMLLGRSWGRSDRLLIGNQFLVAQQHNEVLRQLLSRLTSRNAIASTFVGRRGPGVLTREAGFLSGPIALQERITGYLAALPGRSASHEPGALGFLDPATDQLRTYLWNNVRWLTEESEIYPDAT